MAAIVHFSKQDATQRLGAVGGTTAAEVAEYTVAWSDLTGAGFANGDDVIIFIKATINVNNATNQPRSTWGRGATFAGRTILQTDEIESGSADATLGAREICFLDRLTLATDNNFYTSIQIDTTSTPSLDDYCFFIMKLGDLAADDFRYADTAPTGDAPATVTDGASVTLPASGGDDWLVLGNVRWETDNASDKMISQLSLGGDVRMINSTEGEDPSEQVGRPLIGYLAAAANSAVCLTQYYNVNGSPSPNAVTRTAIFALRMEAFANHAGNMDQDAIAMGGVLNTYVATNTVSLELSATGPVAWFAQTIADVGASAQGPYHRVQLDGTDIVAGLGRASGWSYDSSDELPLTQFGTISMTSGTKVIDVDCANELKTNAFNFDEHTLVAFSMELASSGTTFEQDVTGSITPTGAISRSILKALSGSITPTGAITKSVSTDLIGSITPTGAIVKQTDTFLAGSITPSGTNATTVVQTHAIEGSITPTGALARSILKALAGTLIPVGTITKSVLKALAGSLTPNGSLVKHSTKSFSGSVVPEGTLQRGILFTEELVGALVAAGVLTSEYIEGGPPPGGGGGNPLYIQMADINTSGKVKWVDYIPVSEVSYVATGENRYNNDGHLAVQLLSDTTGLVEWVDYIPVSLEVTPTGRKWSYDNDGFLPIVDNSD